MEIGWNSIRRWKRGGNRVEDGTQVEKGWKSGGKRMESEWNYPAGVENEGGRGWEFGWCGKGVENGKEFHSISTLCPLDFHKFST